MSTKKIMLAASWVIIASTALVVALIFVGVFRLPFVFVNILGANHSLTHWFGWAGTLYIATATPFYPIIKRRYSSHLRKTLNLHILGNLVGVFFVSVHFAHQVTRPAAFYPDLGTGVVLYSTMLILLSTGMIQYSSVVKRFSAQVKFLHPAFALTFYTVIVMHIIQGI